MSRAAHRSVGAARSVNYATSPLLASKTPPWRSRLVVLLVGLAFVGLLGRAAFVQIVGTRFFQAEGDKRFLHKESLPASRGRVLDRHGVVLATSVAMPSIQVDTKTFAADAAQRRALARALGMSAAELERRLDGGGSTVVLRRFAEETTWAQVQALGLAGVHAVREYRRRYPEGEAAAHVVGFTDLDDAGLAGAELSFHDRLAGRAGQRTVLRDRLGRVVEDVGEPLPPEHGEDVQLAIDSKVQFFAWQRARDAVREHGAHAASVVVVDTVSGELLAVANYPSFDPGRRVNVPAAALNNRAVIDAAEPGSAMKPFTIAAALESRRFRPDTAIDTSPGRISVTGATISDAHPHGTLSVAEVLQKSSNVGTVKIAQQLERRELWEMFAAVGIGQRPQVEFPSLASGRLRAWKTWRPVEHATMSYGYGLAASVLQMAHAYTIFARDGELIPLTLVKRDAAEVPVAGRRVIGAATARQVREMLRMAAGPGGTAPKLQSMTLGYSVAGKTGTARKHARGGYTGKYRAWFVGVAPASAPRIVVAVMVDEPGRGQYFAGEVAAPVFSQVVQHTLRMLNVPPDVDVKSQIGARPVTAEPESI